MARRGTEAFPSLGAHCDEPDCNQLDFLPFDCDGCGKVFCAAHRTYRDHGCAKAADQGRTVVVCPDCGDSIERLVPGQDEREILAAHARSRRCDPAKNRKPRCPARRCKEQLTFSNTHHCKGCARKVCLKHRFPADHDCAASARAAAGAAAAAARRAGGECGRGARKEGNGGGWALPASIRSLKIF
ncbi:zinc finger AN1 domain-containing stress-associated protein 17 [Sorghum bicolor]|jgi:predicted nucleic acid binding AN1-type Zn finger protein|nr:zinc finger AN1 domain-containing stress-associated protein 17 [Sorghum bicolor]|eukprot:XP_002462330.1 zinc finger AN1 domain-containing stress-associated protein 17 [Sorghum bicolor]